MEITSEYYQINLKNFFNNKKKEIEYRFKKTQWPNTIINV